MTAPANGVLAATLLCVSAACFVVFASTGPAATHHAVAASQVVTRVQAPHTMKAPASTAGQPTVAQQGAEVRGIGRAIPLQAQLSSPELQGSRLPAALLGGALIAAAFVMQKMRTIKAKAAISLLQPLQPSTLRQVAMAGWSGERQEARLAQVSGRKNTARWLNKAFGGLLAVALIASMLFIPVMPAEAARSAGRVGGNSFSSSRSYSKAPSRNPGYRAPPVTSGGAVTFAPSYGVSSFFFPMSYGFAGYGGYGFIGGGGFFNLIFLMSVVYFVLNFMQNIFGGGDDGYDPYGEPKGSVVKLQIGLLGVARNLQKDLDKLAERADTDSPEGLHFVLQEAVLALLRNPDYCVYGFSEGQKGLSLDDAEDYFNRESMSERGKFKEETLMNYGGISKRSGSSAGTGGYNELIVITLIVAAEGNLTLPQVIDSASLREALQKLGGIRQESMMALELLWTPQEEGDSFTQEDVIRDYPRLNRL